MSLTRFLSVRRKIAAETTPERKLAAYKKMHSISVVSLMAPNADSVHEAIVVYLSARTGLHVRLVGEPSWPEREQLFDREQVQVGWMCGTYYIEKRDKDRANVGLLAAPVMAGERYAGKAVYFSDVVVHSDSRSRFVSVTDQDYDLLRQMGREASTVRLQM